MNNSMKRLIFLIAIISLVSPFLLGLSALAADENTELTEEEWNEQTKGYMSASFTSPAQRIKGNDAVDAMTLMTVQDGHAIYVDHLTGELICLVLVSDGNGDFLKDSNGIYEYNGYWATNPYNIGTSKTYSGTATSEAVKKQMYSQVNVTFTQNSKQQTFMSFSDAAVYNQISVGNIRGGVRSEYILGRQSVRYLLPRLITAQKWQALYDEITLNDPSGFSSEKFASQYTFYGLITEDTTPEIKKQIEDLYAIYPECKNKEVYVSNPNIGETELKRYEKSIIKKYTSYSFDRLDEDHAETGYLATEIASPLFKLAIEYTLDADGINLRLCAGNIRFDGSSYSLDDIAFLPWQGCGDVNNDGFIFTPDGSGSIVNFADVTNLSFSQTDNIYGQDYAFSTIQGANKEVMRLPVFGNAQTLNITTTEKADTTSTAPVTTASGGTTATTAAAPAETTEVKTITNGYLAVVTEGDSLARILTKRDTTASMVQSYTVFNPRPKDTYVISGGISAGTNAMWTVESKRKYVDNFRIKIFILTGEKASISGMAKVYRDYLINKGDLTPLEAEGDIPLFVETLGAIDTTKRILGIPYDTKVALTSFSKTINMLQELNVNENITNIVVKMSGWANGGMSSTVPSGIDVEKVLGGKSGLKKLIEYANANNVLLFPDLDFTYSLKDKMFDGFNAKDDLAKTIDDRNAYKKEYDSIMQSYKYVRKGIISANNMMSFYTKTFKEYSKLGLDSIGITSLGESLSSDFDKDDPLNREDSKGLIVELLEKISADNKNVLISGGNAYALPYATHITNVPLENSMYRYSSASVPFIGMVIHGSVEFTGTALNLSGDFQSSLLRTIENGANPYFIFAMENTSELKNQSGLSQYYSIRYSIWYSDLVEAYNRINAALSDVRKSFIIGYDFVDADNRVVKVTYDNGVVFYINYLLTDYEFTDGGTTYTVAAEDFIKLDGAGNKVIG